MANTLIRGPDVPAPVAPEVPMQNDTRVMMYRKGEARIFASPEAVPAGEGWQDTPVPETAEEPKPAAPDEPVKKPRKVKAPDGNSDGN